jgi:hypothetical protein
MDHTPVSKGDDGVIDMFSRIINNPTRMNFLHEPSIRVDSIGFDINVTRWIDIRIMQPLSPENIRILILLSFIFHMI